MMIMKSLALPAPAGVGRRAGRRERRRHRLRRLDPGTRASGPAPIRALLAAQPATLDPIVGARSAQIVWATMLEPLSTPTPTSSPTDAASSPTGPAPSPTDLDVHGAAGHQFSNGEKADAAAVANTLSSHGTRGLELKSYFATSTVDRGARRHHRRGEDQDLRSTTSSTCSPPSTWCRRSTTRRRAPRASPPHRSAPAPTSATGANAGRDISVKKNADYWGEKPNNEGSRSPGRTRPPSGSHCSRVRASTSPSTCRRTGRAGARSPGSRCRDRVAIKIIAFLDSTKAPFDDPKLREAAALAIDRDEIVKGIFDGQAVADAGMLNVKPGPEAGRRR